MISHASYGFAIGKKNIISCLLPSFFLIFWTAAYHETSNHHFKSHLLHDMETGGCCRGNPSKFHKTNWVPLRILAIVHSSLKKSQMSATEPTAGKGKLLRKKWKHVVFLIHTMLYLLMPFCKRGITIKVTFFIIFNQLSILAADLIWQLCWQSLEKHPVQARAIWKTLSPWISLQNILTSPGQCLPLLSLPSQPCLLMTSDRAFSKAAPRL